MEICGCKECDLPVLALGMCNKHWQRNRKYGSPFALKSQSWEMRGLAAPERFGKQIKFTDNCWEWSGPTEKDGYGIFKGVYEGQSYQRAHRYSWALHNRQNVPKGMMICHRCDNPRCVNPDHLFVGDGGDNMRDKIAKNRHNIPKGELSISAILTEAQALVILADPRPYALIAVDYGVAATTIGSIKAKASWAHLEVESVKNPLARANNRKGKGTKLTEESARAILASTEPGSVLANRYGCSRGLITNIRKRRVWAHIE